MPKNICFCKLPKKNFINTFVCIIHAYKYLFIYRHIFIYASCLPMNIYLASFKKKLAIDSYAPCMAINIYLAKFKNKSYSQIPMRQCISSNGFGQFGIVGAPSCPIVPGADNAPIVAARIIAWLGRAFIGVGWAPRQIKFCFWLD